MQIYLNAQTFASPSCEDHPPILSAPPAVWTDGTATFDRTITGYMTIPNMDKTIRLITGQDIPSFNKIVPGIKPESARYQNGVLSYTVDDLVDMHYASRAIVSERTGGEVAVLWYNVRGGDYENNFTENSGSWRFVPVADCDSPVYKVTWQTHVTTDYSGFFGTMAKAILDNVGAGTIHQKANEATRQSFLRVANLAQGFE